MNRPKLPFPLKSWLAARTYPRRRELWLAVDARLARKDRDRRLRLAFASVPLAAALGWLLVGWLVREVPHQVGPAALRLANRAPLPQWLEPTDRYRVLDLNDGSRITVGQGGRLEVLESSPRTVALALRRGRARFDVRPGGARAWHIACGEVTVQVVGTSFTVARSPTSVGVVVQRGVVLVRGARVPDGVQRLAAGHSLVVDVAAQPPAPAGADQAAEEAMHEGEMPRPGASEDGSQGATTKSGSSGHEPRFAPPAPSRAPAPADDTRALAERLWHSADRARIAGEPRQALALLHQLVEAHPSDPRASLAAFAMVRIRLDVTREPDLAVRDLERALALGLPRAFFEDAFSRWLEAQVQSGRNEGECALALEYRSRFSAERLPATVAARCFDASSSDAGLGSRP